MKSEIVPSERPLIVVGKPGTGKTTKALNLLPPNPIIKYADEYDIDDNFSIPIESGILIEEVHYKPKVDLIVKTLLEYKGKIEDYPGRDQRSIVGYHYDYREGVNG